ncbi:MAG: TonB-dependent siderophore receptor [Nostoc sp.]|uniref:TonB-dependent siderophore receptor n=1 Tax=Nostoc sp. TaxID=1180 RepID=UPI002FF85C1B
MLIKLQYPAVCWLIFVVSLTLANPAYPEQPLVKKTLVRSGDVFQEIQTLNQLQLPKTDASYLWRVPRQNKFPELSQATTDVVLVTDVKVNSTNKGIELILVTANSLKLQVLPKTEGNSYIADIPNAKLQLRSGDFRQSKPVAGIALITVANLDANTLRVTVTGEAFAPAVELFDSTKEGLVFGVTSTARQPTPTPEQQPIQEKQPPIELEVTAPPDTGYRIPDTSVGTRTDTPLRDIPQSIDVIPRQVLEDQGTTRIGEVLKDYGILQGAAPPRSSDEFIIRGFDTINTLRNGLRDNLNRSTNGASTPNIERIEILRGPTSVLYGQGDPGGIVNIITKKPLSQPYYSIAFGVGSYSFYQPSIDFSGPLTSDGTLLYRLNAAYSNSGSFIDFFNPTRTFVSPVITWHPNSKTTLTLEGEYQDSRIIFDPGLPAQGTVLPNSNGEISRSRFIGEPTDFSDRQTGRIGYTFEHRLNDDWVLRNALQITLLRYEQQSTTPVSLLPDNRTLRRRTQKFLEPVVWNNYLLDTNIIGKFKTGSVQHQLLFGLDLYRDIQATFNSTLNSIGSINLFNPIYGQPLGTVNNQINRKNRDDALGIYAQDQVTLAENLKLILSGRIDFVENNVTNVITSQETSQSDSAFSPRIGLVYQPIKPVSLYASFGQSFYQNIGTAFDGSAFKPSRGTQYEVGVKTDFLNGKLSSTLALYQLTLSNVVTPDLVNQTFDVQTGEQRSRGIELNVTGEILPGWNVIVYYAYNDAQITSDNLYKVGNRVALAPDNVASLWTTYTLPKQGFTARIGIWSRFILCG